MLQVSENRIEHDNFEQNIGFDFDNTNNCVQNALIRFGTQPKSVPVRIYEPEKALDLSVADKKGEPEVVSDIEATLPDSWQKYQLVNNANIREIPLLEASPAQTAPPNSLGPSTDPDSSKNLTLSWPLSASFWSMALSPKVRWKTEICDQMSNPDKKMKLQVPVDNQRFSASTEPVNSAYESAGAASMEPSPAKYNDENPFYRHQLEAIVTQRLPQIQPHVFSLSAASSYGLPNSQPDVGIRPGLVRFDQTVGPQDQSGSMQFDRIQPESFKIKRNQQPRGANALNSVPIMRQQQHVEEQNIMQSSAMNHLSNLSTTLELVQAKIGKDHQLIPMLRKMSFRCHVCGSCFEDRHRLQQHLSIHLQLRPSWFEELTIKDTMAKYESRRGDYLCNICHLRHDTTAEFDKHMQQHGERPHQCELCLKDNKTVSFRFFRQLLTHLRSHCFIYKCRFAPDCKQTANRKDYLKLHILKHHLNNKLSDQYVIAAHNIDNLSDQVMDRMVR